MSIPLLILVEELYGTIPEIISQGAGYEMRCAEVVVSISSLFFSRHSQRREALWTPQLLGKSLS